MKTTTTTTTFGSSPESREKPITLILCAEYMCVLYMCVLSSHLFWTSKFVGRTSRGHKGGRSHRISYPPSFCGACLNFSRDKDSAIPFPRRPQSRILCTNDLIVFHLLGICCCCCCLHIKSRSGLYSVLSNIRTGPTGADAFRGHRLTTQKGYTYQKEIKGPRKVNTHAIIRK